MSPATDDSGEHPCNPSAAGGPRILVVEDDARLRELLQELLTAEGYAVSTETRGDRAIERIRSQSPDLVVLDIGLPGCDGLEVCRRVRRDWSGRILMLTARGDEFDEVLGLELGADDYLAKPVAPRRLLARVRALLRRDVESTTEVVRVAGLVVDLGRRHAELDGRPLALKTAEFDLLAFLAANAGRVVSRDDIHRALRGAPQPAPDRSIDLRISRLRKYLGDDPREPTWIKTVHGAGYLLVRNP